MIRNALVVEANSETQAWMLAALRDAYHLIEVTTATCLADAYRISEWNYFSLILVDLQLPDGSGVDFIRKLSLAWPDAYCVVATDFDDDAHLFPALKAGAKGYILKTQSKERFSIYLQGILAGVPPLSPTVARRLLSHFREEIPANTDQEVHLTPREQEVLTLIAKGLKLSEVADLMQISYNTVTGYVKAIYRKLDISSRAEATLAAMRIGLVKPS